MSFLTKIQYYYCILIQNNNKVLIQNSLNTNLPLKKKLSGRFKPKKYW